MDDWERTRIQAYYSVVPYLSNPKPSITKWMPFSWDKKVVISKSDIISREEMDRLAEKYKNIINKNG